jgi:hypothetical protein
MPHRDRELLPVALQRNGRALRAAAVMWRLHRRGAGARFADTLGWILFEKGDAP